MFKKIMKYLAITLCVIAVGYSFYLAAKHDTTPERYYTGERVINEPEKETEEDKQ